MIGSKPKLKKHSSVTSFPMPDRLKTLLFHINQELALVHEERVKNNEHSYFTISIQEIEIENGEMDENNNDVANVPAHTSE